MNGLTEDQEFTDADRSSGKRFVWECAIGGRNAVTVPPGGDLPMRRAVEQAFYELTGEHAEYTYSGWGRKFTDKALSVWPVAPRRVHWPLVIATAGVCIAIGYAIGVGVAIRFDLQ